MKVDGIDVHVLADSPDRGWLVSGWILHDDEPEVTTAGLIPVNGKFPHTDPAWVQHTVRLTGAEVVDLPLDPFGRLFKVAEYLVERGRPV